MGQIKFTTAEVEQILDGRMHSFVQDVADNAHTSGSPQAITAETEYLFTNNALGRNVAVAPTYISSRWDAANSKVAFPDEHNTPTYVADIAMSFNPSVSSQGLATLRVYIDTSGARNFATDPLIRSYVTDYKGIAESMSTIATWYLGEETGYDAKNDGVYFTVEFSTAGDLYNKNLVVYRT